MTRNPWFVSLGAFVGIWLVSPGFSQGPISDKLHVTFSEPVVVSGTRLAPGDYTIRQIASASNPNILEFSSSNGTEVDVTVTTIPALDNRNINPTRVMLEQRSGEQHIKQLWIEGKSYGYEFAVSTPTEGRNMAARNGGRLIGTYTIERTVVTTPSDGRPSEPATTKEESANRQAQEQQQAQARTESENRTTQTEQPTPAPAPPEQTAQQERSNEVAQQTPPPTPAPATPQTPAAQPDQQPERPATPPEQPTQPPAAERRTTQEQATTSDTTLPATAANWLQFVVGGVGLIAGGGALLAKRNGS